MIDQNNLATTKLYDSNKYIHIIPIKYSHPTILQIIYNQTPIVQYICIDPFNRWYYPSHKSKQCPPFSNTEWTPKNISSSTTSILCRKTTSGHEYYSYPHHTQQHPSSAPTYCLPLWYPLPNSGPDLSLPIPVPPTDPLIYNLKKT